MFHMEPKCCAIFLTLAFCLGLGLASADETSLPFGDGVADATGPIQQLLDAAGKTGSEVHLPPGQYFLNGNIKIPKGVTLRGSWDEPHHGSVWNLGTTLLITSGKGQETGPAAIDMAANAGLSGLTLLWPEQTTAGGITPYPWAIHGSGTHDSVENVTLVNAYQGISMGGPGSDGSLHLIRNVYGCVLRRGIMVDTTTDIGRIENVHFNPHYWGGSHHPSWGADRDSHKVIHDYISQNLEAFIFGRSDWEYVVDTFVWGGRSGYLFIKTAAGACNGQFLGIGADYCQACVRIDEVQPIGIQVTNGEFTAFAGEPNSAIVTSPGANGAAQFVNCNFWGVRGHVALMQGTTEVTISDCHICDKFKESAVLAESGKLILRGCSFDQPCLAVVLKPEVKAAIIAENLQPGGLQIDNGIGTRAVIGLNEAAPPETVAPKPESAPAPTAPNPAPATKPAATD